MIATAPSASTSFVPLQPSDYDYLYAIEQAFNTLKGTDEQQELQNIGIRRVQDEQGEAISGVLVCDTGIEGPAAAILAATHMNELAGFAGIEAFMEAWKQGIRPASGKVYLIVGGDEQQVENAFSIIHASEPYGGVDIHELTSLRVSGDHHRYNYNRLPEEVLEAVREGRASFANKHDKRVAELMPLLAETQGRILDIHSYSNEGRPMAIPCIKTTNEADSPGKSVSRKDVPELLRDNEEHAKLGLNSVLKDMAVDYIYTDLASSAGIRLLPLPQHEAIPVLYETGGPHLDPKCGVNAAESVIAWINNVMGSGLTIPEEKATEFLETFPWFSNAKAQSESHLEHPFILTDVQLVYPPAHPAAAISHLYDATPGRITPQEDVYLILQNRELLESLVNDDYTINKELVETIIRNNTTSAPEITQQLLQSLTNLQDTTELPIGVRKIRVGLETSGDNFLVKNFEPCDQDATLAIGLFSGYEVTLPKCKPVLNHVERLAEAASPSQRIFTMMPQKSDFGPDMQESLCMVHLSHDLERGKDGKLALPKPARPQLTSRSM